MNIFSKLEKFQDLINGHGKQRDVTVARFMESFLNNGLWAFGCYLFLGLIVNEPKSAYVFMAVSFIWFGAISAISLVIAAARYFLDRD